MKKYIIFNQTYENNNCTFIVNVKYRINSEDTENYYLLNNSGIQIAFKKSLENCEYYIGNIYNN